MWLQRQIQLQARPRGFHLITGEIVDSVPEIRSLKVGLLHVFIQHTSASLTVNENADPTVRQDFERYFTDLVPEGRHYLHHDEGPDDLPAHIKSSMLGSSVSLPIGEGGIRSGIWQGVYLCEHRNHAGGRRLIVTLQGE